MYRTRNIRLSAMSAASVFILAACVATNSVVKGDSAATLETTMIHPEKWPEIMTAALDPAVEARVDDLLSKMTLKQKVGQVIQGDTNSLTAEDVKNYRLGSVLSGGNSAPGDKPYAGTQAWLDAADAYYAASIDPEGVEVAIPMIWGIDAVHGHTNLIGGVVFPHNIGLGAANDPDLIHRISEITAQELNVSGHDWTFAPTLAVPQNDRWGRAYEGFSENPDIVKSYGGEIVMGLQGEIGSDGFMGPDRVISTAKHFLGDGGTENGVDQGDARISEGELRDIHLPGYETAIATGAQSVMASFSSWQGQPMHGQKELMTDVLKGRMNFQGFVVGDWNGHALIPDCTATDCPQALNAGLDMYMAPDSWKGLYESTLKHVESGRIPMARLDDAVRRILRAKVNSGIFEKPQPSLRPLSGRTDLLGSSAHRDVAREAVRKSLVLLKNNDQTLPLAENSRVHVVGAGADSITKLAGGWTLSWQGRDHVNSDFPNGESFLTALKREVEGAGGTVTFDAEGSTVPTNTDVVIAVFGEDPYAEFQGDIENVDFVPNDFDTNRLGAFKAAGLPVVSVFISGRPLWTNPEMNDSDAFVAAWLPGSEAAGISDLLFQTEPDYDFTGRLSFSWPKLATQVLLNKQHPNYDPLFELGYGLSLSDNVDIGPLSEESGVENAGAQKSVIFAKGVTSQPWRLAVNGSTIDLPYRDDAVTATAYDMAAQEDSLRLAFSDAESVFSIASGYPLDYAREANGAMELSFMMMSLSGDKTVRIGAGCIELAGCKNFHALNIGSEWKETRISLRCAAKYGVDLQYMKNAFTVEGQADLDVAVANVILKQESSDSIRCD
ncbi:MAG: glycoside hydrolase family 3 N-terminal domain-containing protein [Litorimonas sp.]